ncbi:MAG: universal stress protein, partial [Deltaproteobacteria bacterium]|nr:universal stress protein [Deltaproteobacteria bacterium]
MQIKKLLFVTDFEELWFDALQSLMDLRKVGLSHVVFLQVIEREKVAMHRGTGYLKSEELKLKEMA